MLENPIASRASRAINGYLALVSGQGTHAGETLIRYQLDGETIGSEIINDEAQMLFSRLAPSFEGNAKKTPGISEISFDLGASNFLIQLMNVETAVQHNTPQTDISNPGLDEFLNPSRPGTTVAQTERSNSVSMPPSGAQVAKQ